MRCPHPRKKGTAAMVPNLLLSAVVVTALSFPAFAQQFDQPLQQPITDSFPCGAFVANPDGSVAANQSVAVNGNTTIDAGSYAANASTNSVNIATLVHQQCRGLSSNLP
jgi:hypothetical protein